MESNTQKGSSNISVVKKINNDDAIDLTDKKKNLSTKIRDFQCYITQFLSPVKQ